MISSSWLRRATICVSASGGCAAARWASRSGRRPCRHSAASFLSWRAPFGSSTSETEACHWHEGGGCVFAERGVLPSSLSRDAARPSPRLVRFAARLARLAARLSRRREEEEGGGGGGGSSPDLSTFLQTEGFTPFLAELWSKEYLLIEIVERRTLSAGSAARVHAC